MSSANASITGITIPEEYVYGCIDEGTHTHRLLPTVITVHITGIHPRLRLMAIPEVALPFGLIEGIELRGRDDESLPEFRIHVMKTTGQRVTRRVTPARGQGRVSILCAEMNTDQDAADAALASTKACTGHDMRFRMLAGNTIVSLAVEFYDVPPSSFNIMYHGANGVGADVDATSARGTMASKRPLKLLLPPISKQQRLSAVST